jgi:alanyl-tRNA synthetase
MRPTSAGEIREAFLRFFEARGHRRVPSSSLVPDNDPTLLFTNAGMVQFKDVFTGAATLPFRRATTAQKCMRAGGKHNDLENVGRTPRHHTFFEMLGNFSFGDYFKREAIAYAWEFVTGVLGLPPERLWATVFRDDEEAARLWVELTAIPPERVVRLGEKENFWAMGETGPCGPCSEIVVDRGEEHRCGAERCGIGACDCPRWLEIWNLVFMQYERAQDGTLSPLPRPSIDTGMGLERVASLQQGVASNFDTDLFRPIVGAVEAMTGRAYDPGPDGFPFRVIADHARACAFLVADGVLPANEGRGHVLRRILRRAVRFGRRLGMQRPFLNQLVPVVAELMGDAYPELRERQDAVVAVILREEERFGETLAEGLAHLEEALERVRAAGGRVLPGEVAFQLYDTFGFPLDLTEDAAAEVGVGVDREGFERALSAQRERARADRRTKVRGYEAVAVADLAPTEFVGYTRMDADSEVVAVLPGEGAADAFVVLDRTPFYPEGGGQVGDTGALAPASGGSGPVASLQPAAQVIDTRRAGRDVILHAVRWEGEPLAPGAWVRAAVEEERRRGAMRNHSATHLLHRALREVLGPSVHQAGSLVAPDRLRFDFTFDRPVDPDRLREVERLVNERILDAIPVEWFVTDLDEARAMGAMALFGEKYGQRVRVVRMGDWSLELCGGTHVGNTAEIGLFAITGETGIGAGIRRVEAVTGRAVTELVDRQRTALARVAEALRAPVEEVEARLRELMDRLAQRERALAEAERRLARTVLEDLAARAETVDGVRLVAGQVPLRDMEAMRELADDLRRRLGSAAVLLGAAAEGRALLLCALTPDLVARGLDAGRIVARAARVAGGGGGGRPDLAQAGGRDPARIPDALREGVAAVKEILP